MDIITFIQNGGVLFIFKILLLIAIFVYILFTIIIISRVRALNRTIYLAASHASMALLILSIISFLLAVSLFIATLVIV
jgi:hypothetical protein